MMKRPKCIVLNGFAGAGKTTIAQRYIEDHPMALAIEGDEMIIHMGQWTEYENDARKQVYELTKAMVATHLAAGYDVILPYLVMDARHMKAIEQIAKDSGAEFYEILLHNERDHAIERLMKRGTWGEAGLPPITANDRPQIEKDIAIMEAQLEKRPRFKTITVKEDAIDETYRQVLACIA